MSVTKKIADSIDNIPSAIDFAKVYNGKIDDTDTDSPGTERIETLRDRPSLIFAHPPLFTLFGGETKVNTNDVLQRIVYMLTHPDGGREVLSESTKLLQFIWEAGNGLTKPTNTSK